MRKGQAEIIAILGIIIVAIVAILFATQTVGPPQAVSLEEKTVRDSLENMIRSGADESMRVLSTHGGFITPEDSIIFLQKEIPFWFKNGATSIPNTKKNFEQMLEQYINTYKDSFVSGLSGDITVGDASVAANYLDNKVILNVKLPATLNGKPIPANYDIEILTKFGEILDFSENFIKYQNENRYLEYFMLASILASPIEDGTFTTPMFVHLTNCGEFIFKSWADLKSNMEERVEVTLAHTYMPGKAPTNVGDITPYPKYIIPPLNNKRYSDLDISFHLPDDFELEPLSFQFTPNPIIAVAQPLAFTGICTSDPIYVNYFLNIPMIVRVKDPITQNVFQFAGQTFIKNNAPGQWSQQEIYEQDVQAAICANPDCPVTMNIRSLEGNPIPYTDVSFMGCSVGKTDSTGVLETIVPCGVGPLEIYRSGYAYYKGIHSYTELEDVNVQLAKMLNPTVYFYETSVVNNTLTNEYWVNGIKPVEDRVVILTLRSLTDTDKTFTRIFKSFSDKLSQIPADMYAISATITDNNMQTVYGSLTTTSIFLEDTNEIHFYIPYSLEFNQIQDQNKLTFTSIIYSSVVDNCDIGPLSPTQLDDTNVLCIKQYDEV